MKIDMQSSQPMIDHQPLEPDTGGTDQGMAGAGAFRLWAGQFDPFGCDAGSADLVGCAPVTKQGIRSRSPVWRIGQLCRCWLRADRSTPAAEPRRIAMVHA